MNATVLRSINRFICAPLSPGPQGLFDLHNMLQTNRLKSNTAPPFIGWWMRLSQPGACFRNPGTFNKFQAKQGILLRKFIDTFIRIFPKWYARHDKT